MLPPTPPQTGLLWHIGEESAAAEFRQASRAWAKAYLTHEYADLTPLNWKLHKQHAHNVDVLFICMRLQTMSRARETRAGGPGPLRTRRWPWGLPQVGGAARDALERDNEWIRMTLSAMKEVSTQSSHPTIILVAPEDRGGDAASLWQLPELRQFATDGGWFRYGFHQCEMVPSASPRPTAVLSLSPLRDPTLAKGWPKLKDSGDTYLGPLTTSCKCGRTHEPWSKKPRQQAFTTLQQGVVSRLLSIAYRSGLARHLRTGTNQARQSLPSSSRSPSPSPSIASSSGSTTTRVSSPSLTTDKDPSSVQWDDDAAEALGIPKRDQDGRDTPIVNTSTPRFQHRTGKPCSQSYNWDILWPSSLWLCAATTRWYARYALLTA